MFVKESVDDILKFFRQALRITCLIRVYFQLSSRTNCKPRRFVRSFLKFIPSIPTYTNLVFKQIFYPSTSVVTCLLFFNDSQHICIFYVQTKYRKRKKNTEFRHIKPQRNRFRQKYDYNRGNEQVEYCWTPNGVQKSLTLKLYFIIVF